MRGLSKLAILWILLQQVCWGQGSGFSPLGKQELARSVELIKKSYHLGRSWFLANLQRRECKDPVIPTLNLCQHEAEAIVFNAREKQSFELVIDLEKNKISHIKRIHNGQPPLVEPELEIMKKLLKVSQRVKKALAKRKLSLDETFVEPWAMGYLPPNLDPSHRYLRAVFFHKGEATNGYGRPIEGISVVIDMTARELVKFHDSGVRPIVSDTGDFMAAEWRSRNERKRLAIKPLEVKQTHGTSFQIEGNTLSWDIWQLEFQIHPREGLVIHNLGIIEEDKFRSVMNRGSMSEMVVPYGDPDANWFWRTAYDQGDYHLGLATNTMLAGAHVPRHAELFSSTFVDAKGNFVDQPATLGIYERDGGIQWTHYDESSGKTAGQRARELVLVSFFTIGNYDYGIHWIFKQDGSFDIEVKLTGVLQAKGSKVKLCQRCLSNPELSKDTLLGDRYGTVVDQHVVAIVHQHFFNFRLDMAIEGNINQIAEVGVAPETLDRDPQHQAFIVTENLLMTEAGAKRSINPKTAPHWWVFHPQRKNRIGHYMGYILEPGPNVHAQAKPDSDLFKRAGFVRHNLWVTPYHPEERHAAGHYPSQGSGDGLRKWTKRNRSLNKKDLVLWYTAGITHIPRAEEWPIMSAAQTKFSLKPMGFFSRNPSLGASPVMEKWDNK